LSLFLVHSNPSTHLERGLQQPVCLIQHQKARLCKVLCQARVGRQQPLQPVSRPVSFMLLDLKQCNRRQKQTAHLPTLAEWHATRRRLIGQEVAHPQAAGRGDDYVRARGQLHRLRLHVQDIAGKVKSTATLWYGKVEQ